MKPLMIIMCIAFFSSCNNEKKTAGEFTVSGNIKNAPDQDIFLEEVYFSDKPPHIIDTAKLVNGNFTLTGIAPEQGLYRLLIKDGSYIFINDGDKITSTIDAKAENIFSFKFNTPANSSLIKFLHLLDSSQTALKQANAGLQPSHQPASNDSLQQSVQNSTATVRDQYKNFILKYADTTESPVLALFVLGYSEGIDPVALDKTIEDVFKKFPHHTALNEIINQYKQRQVQGDTKPATPAQNAVAPEINLPDTAGKLFSLSSLKGKFVLVDFWASWCGPCREENPNVVRAYNKFKNKNFAILGVSLDRDKSDWLKAIKDDGLTWNHVSDLKFWNSAVVPLYNIEGIPYNVLVDPAGKIIANSLRGPDLENKLSEVLK